MNIDELKKCFRVNSPVIPGREFIHWLLKSNNPKIKAGRAGSNLYWDQVEKESLQEILDILLREPLADYFWYGCPDKEVKLFYALPTDDEVSGGETLRVDKEKIKSFLREYKIEFLLNKV